MPIRAEDLSFGDIGAPQHHRRIGRGAAQHRGRGAGEAGGGLTALGLGQTIFKLRGDTKHIPRVVPSRPVEFGGPFLAPQALWASRNSLMRPRTEPDNAQYQRREYCNIHHCINHASLH